MSAHCIGSARLHFPGRPGQRPVEHDVDCELKALVEVSRNECCGVSIDEREMLDW
jgi:hypothetical protein